MKLTKKLIVAMLVTVTVSAVLSGCKLFNKKEGEGSSSEEKEVAAETVELAPVEASSEPATETTAAEGTSGEASAPESTTTDDKATS
jgi:hypothetical protein